MLLLSDWSMALPLTLLREGRNGEDLSELLFRWRQKVVPTFNSMSAETGEWSFGFDNHQTT